MLSQDAIKYLKDKNYSFEEIKGINVALKQSEEGQIISKQEIQNFIKTELFSKYSVNV